MTLLRRPTPPAQSVLARLGGLLARQGWTPSSAELLLEDDATAAAPTVAAPRSADRGLLDRSSVDRTHVGGVVGPAGGTALGPADPDAERTSVVPGPRGGAAVTQHGARGDDAGTTAAWRRGRFDPGRRGAAALAVLALVAGLLAAAVVLRARPHAVVPPAVVATGQSGSGSTPATTPAAAVLVVAVDGKVVHPGLVRLPAGSRVDDGIRAAGGALPGTDLAGLNLARKLADGEQVVVGAPPPVSGQLDGPAAGQPGGLVDLNAATVADLDGLPGIGPVLAQHIVDWRTEHGPFGSVDQLREVIGIGESKYAQLKGKVRI